MQKPQRKKFILVEQVDIFDEQKDDKSDWTVWDVLNSKEDDLDLSATFSDKNTAQTNLQSDQPDNQPVVVCKYKPSFLESDGQVQLSVEKRPESLRIYDCRVDIASPEYGAVAFNHFCLNVLPIIKRQSYNAIRLTAVMEHSYYASFGYQVTFFFSFSRSSTNSFIN